MSVTTKREGRIRRHLRVRKKVSGTAARPRLAVFRSNRHIYAQLIDDVAGRTVVAASDREVGAGSGKVSVARSVGELLADRARSAGVETAVFDRGGRLYHGRVAAIADGAREKGLRI
ncbi:MAG: 50S ribosomal protein L18 [Actinomycetota bacterium]